MAKNTHYVVWVGRDPGIYSSWSQAENQIKGFPNAKYKGFPSKGEAEAAFAASPTPAPASKPSATRLTDVAIYCDGACEGNPGPCGTGVAVYQGGVLAELHYGLHKAKGTNNIAELLGLIYALQMAKEHLAADRSVIIYSDSQYGIDCITNVSVRRSHLASGYRFQLCGSSSSIALAF